MSRTPRLQLQFDLLPTPVLAKGVRPFLLSRFDSIARVRPGIPFLVFHPLKEQTERSISVVHDSAYHVSTFWLFPTGPGALLLVHTCMIPCQSHQVWRQWWLQLGDPINLGSSRPTHIFFPLSLLWRIYSSDLTLPWCIRGLARTDAEVKARWDR